MAVAVAVIAAAAAGLVVARAGDEASVNGAAAGDTTSSTSSSTTTTAERMVAITTTTEPPPTTTTTPDYAAEDTGIRLVYLEMSLAIVVDLDRNTASRVELPAMAAMYGDEYGYAQAQARAAGDDLFFAAESRAWSVSLSGKRAHIDLGEAYALIGGAQPGRVNIAVRQGNDLVLREVDRAGRVTATSKPLPPDWRPHGWSPGGVLLVQFGRYQVWDPVTGATRWKSDDSATAVLGVSATSVVWQRPCEMTVCRLHVTDLASGADRSFLIPSGTNYGPDSRATAAIDPDGRRVAVAGFERSGGGSPAVHVYDVETGEHVSHPVANVSSARWSSDGRWLLGMGDESERQNQLIHLWRADGLKLRQIIVRPPAEAEGPSVVVAR